MNLVKFFMDTPEEVNAGANEVVAQEENVAADPAQSFVQVEEPVVEEKVDEVVDLAADAVSTEIAPAPSAAIDEGLVLSPNTAAQPVDAGLNITA